MLVTCRASKVSRKKTWYFQTTMTWAASSNALFSK